LILLLQLASLLLVGLLLSRSLLRIGLPAIVGELLAGVVLGPSLLGHLAPRISRWLFPHDANQMHLLESVGQVGVLLLVGLAGIYLDTQGLRRRGAIAFRISFLGVLIPFCLGVSMGYLAPGYFLPKGVARLTLALLVGVAMCVTAIPVIAKTLADMKLTHRTIGQLTLTAATFDDTVGWFMLSVVSAIATVGLTAGRVTLAVGYLLGFVLLAFLVGRPVVRFVLHRVGRRGEPGVTVSAAVVLILLGGTTTLALGMEPVFGAFVVGILIGASGLPDKRPLGQLRTVVLNVLAPVFLATAGLRMDLTVLRHPQVLVAAVVVLLVAVLGKFAGAFLGAISGGMSRWESLAIGAGMNSRGVIEIIVAITGLRLGVLNVTTFTIIALVAIVTSIMTPPLLRLAMSRVSHSDEELRREADHATWEGSLPAHAVVPQA